MKLYSISTLNSNFDTQNIPRRNLRGMLVLLYIA